MVLNDWMKVGVTDDEEEIVAHGNVSFAPGIEEKKYKQEGTISTQQSRKDYSTHCRIVNHPIAC